MQTCTDAQLKGAQPPSNVVQQPMAAMVSSKDKVE